MLENSDRQLLVANARSITQTRHEEVIYRQSPVNADWVVAFMKCNRKIVPMLCVILDKGNVVYRSWEDETNPWYYGH